MGIIPLIPNEEEFPRMCEQEDRAMKEVWEGRVGAQPNTYVI